MALQDLVAALEAAQAVTISFNPITTANTAKALKAILQREKLALPEEQVCVQTCWQRGMEGRWFGMVCSLWMLSFSFAF